MLVALVLVGLLLGGCGIGPDRTADATVIAEQYLTHVAGGAEDRGWSLLHPNARRDMFGDSVDLYLNAVATSDWTDFDFSVEWVVPDDPRLYLVQFKTNDPPDFLVQTWGRNQILDASQEGRAIMMIRFETFVSGVWPWGG